MNFPSCVLLQELILPLLLLGLLIFISTLNPHVYHGGIDTVELDSVDHFKDIKGLGYTPATNITIHIMEEVAQLISKSRRRSRRPEAMALSGFVLWRCFWGWGVADMQDRLEVFPTEEELENASLYEPSSFIGVVFLDSSATSYRLRFPYNKLPLPSDYTESIGKKKQNINNCM